MRSALNTATANYFTEIKPTRPCTPAQKEQAERDYREALLSALLQYARGEFKPSFTRGDVSAYLEEEAQAADKCVEILTKPHPPMNMNMKERILLGAYFLQKNKPDKAAGMFEAALEEKPNLSDQGCINLITEAERRLRKFFLKFNNPSIVALHVKFCQLLVSAKDLRVIKGLMENPSYPAINVAIKWFDLVHTAEQRTFFMEALTSLFRENFNQYVTYLFIIKHNKNNAQYSIEASHANFGQMCALDNSEIIMAAIQCINNPRFKHKIYPNGVIRPKMVKLANIINDYNEGKIEELLSRLCYGKKPGLDKPLLMSARPGFTEGRVDLCSSLHMAPLVNFFGAFFFLRLCSREPNIVLAREFEIRPFRPSFWKSRKFIDYLKCVFSVDKEYMKNLFGIDVYTIYKELRPFLEKCIEYGSSFLDHRYNGSSYRELLGYIRKVGDSFGLLEYKEFYQEASKNSYLPLCLFPIVGQYLGATECLDRGPTLNAN